MDEIVDVVDILGAFISRPHHNLFVVVEITLGNALNLTAHCGRKKQRIALGRPTGQDFVDAIGETHVEHLVSFVKHHVLNIVELGHATMHKVDESTRCGHDDLYAFAQTAYLALNARAAIDGQNLEAVNVAGIVFEVAGNLQTEFAGRTEDDGLCVMVGRVYLLQNRQAVCSRLARSGLSQGNHVVTDTQEIRDNFLLHRHRIFVAHFGYGASNVFRHAQFFKCFQKCGDVDVKL